MTVRIINADVVEGLKSLADESVHCVVTSPPYWGLRDYGTGTWEGGDAGCSHKQGRDGAFSANGGMPGGRNRDGASALVRNVCVCGAKRVDRQIGLEKTPQEFVARMVEVFREVRRVLRKDGVCFVNLGDSYNSGNSGGLGGSTLGGGQDNQRASNRHGRDRVDGLKPKDLIGIPWRVALALQDDGWYLRQDIIWHKPNPMPESVTDRCTKAHEYIFLLTKAERYWWDGAAISEPALNAGHVVKTNGNDGMCDGYDGHRTRDALKRGVVVKDERNKRSVWTIATAPFSEAHFATFPPELPEICIKAGCPKGGTVLDPFGGAGTTGLVADRLQRHAILIELNPEYAAMARRRIDGDRGGLLDVMEAAE